MSNFDTSNLPTRGIKPLVSLLAHPKLAIVVFLAVLVLGIPVTLIKGKSFYYATATLQVAPRYMKNLRDDGELSFPSNTQYREFLEQQSKSVLRFDIVQDALRSFDSSASPWPRLPGESERLSIDRLRTQMFVKAIPDTYMIELGLQSEAKNGLADVVNAVSKAYVERMKTERIYGSDVRIRNLETREKELTAGILSKTEVRTTLALQLGISAFTGKEENPYDRVVSDMRTTVSETRNKRIDAVAKLNAFEAKNETDINTRSVQEAVLIDPGLANLKSNLYKRRADLLEQLVRIKPEHPAYSAINEEMQRIEEEISSQTDLLSKQVGKSLLARYQTTVIQSRQIESNLSYEFNMLEKKGANFALLYNKAMTLALDIEQDRKELNVVRDRLNELQAEENSFGFVRVASPALAPEVPFGTGKKKIFLMMVLVALFAGLAAPVIRDVFDRLVHTVNDAERVLGIPALGWMVERSNASTGMLGDDLLRRLAGGMTREQSDHGTKVFAFSAVKPGAGNTELTLLLAQALDALGYPALVIEANAFKPDSRMKNAGSGKHPGLAQCLLKEVSPMACVIPATQNTPARVWVGDTKGQRHLDRLDRMGEMIAEWSQTYRFILVDLPPLLLSADAEILSRSLEHLIMVVEASGITTGELRRAGRQVEKLNPSAVGMLVNRVQPFNGGGYMRDMLVEYLSGRKASEFFIQPSWIMELRSQLMQQSFKLFTFFSRKQKS